jgi:hypothetical protein
VIVRWIVITRDNDGGYRIQLRSRLAGTAPEMLTRKQRTPSEARREAERIFGDGLYWQSRHDVGLDGQPYVVEVAEIEIRRRA